MDIFLIRIKDWVVWVYWNFSYIVLVFVIKIYYIWFCIRRKKNMFLEKLEFILCRICVYCVEVFD